MTAPPARLLHLTGVPHIHFPPYTRAESIHIVSSSPLPLGNISKSEVDWLWTTFCGIVWDSMGKAVARDIVAFREVCRRLWKPFVQPIVQGDYAPHELHKLIIKNRALFQGDSMIEPEIVPRKSSPSITSNPEPGKSILLSLTYDVKLTESIPRTTSPPHLHYPSPHCCLPSLPHSTSYRLPPLLQILSIQTQSQATLYSFQKLPPSSQNPMSPPRPCSLSDRTPLCNLPCNTASGAILEGYRGKFG